MIFRLVNWINDVFSPEKTHNGDDDDDDDDDDIMQSLDNQQEQLSSHLDGRWEPVDQEGTVFQFNSRYMLPHRIGESSLVSALEPEYIALEDLIRALQLLNAEFRLSTLTQPLSTASSSSASSRRGSALLENYGSGSMSQRERRMRQLRFEYRLLKQRRRRALRQAQRRNMWRSEDDPVRQKIERELQELQHDDHDDNLDNDGDNRSKAPLHVIRDFDELQQRYLEAVEEAQDIEDEQRMFLQRSQEQLDRELALLDKCARSYVYAPLLKDEHYRSINNELFQEFDDDPVAMLLAGSEGISISNPVTRKLRETYPKMRVLSKRTLEDRARRRYLMLSSPLDGTGSNHHHIDDNRGGGDDDDMEVDDRAAEWEIETERISGLLGQFVPNSHRRAPWDVDRFWT